MEKITTTKTTFNRYLCFIVVNLLRNCIYRLKLNSSGLEKSNLSHLLTQFVNLRFTKALFTIFKCLENYFLKKFRSEAGIFLTSNLTEYPKDELFPLE